MISLSRRVCLRNHSLQSFLLLLWMAALYCLLLRDGGRTTFLDGDSALLLQGSSRPHRADVHLANRNLRNEAEYFEHLLELSGSCRKLLSLGGFSCKGHFDGDKLVCMDNHVKPPHGDCLVYSFGIGDDITFEGALSYLSKCEIHMYDPFQNSSWLEGNLEENMYYHPAAISARNEISIIGDNQTLVYSTFEKILRDNGHLGRTIHYLKMDIESTEWEVLSDMLDKGLLDTVMQLAMEIHTKHLELLPFASWLPALQKQHDILKRLEETGFRKISYIMNNNLLGAIKLPYEKEMRAACGEIFYVRDPQSSTRSSSKNSE